MGYMEGKVMITDGRDGRASLRRAKRSPEPTQLTKSSALLEDMCEVCGVADPVWFAPNELWNRVMASEGFICPVCFIKRAEAKGIVPTAWSLQEETPLKIEREWAMPSRWTFTIKPIAQLLNDEVVGVSVDPFAGESQLATHNNYLDESGLDCLAYLAGFDDGFVDTVLYDPPYSITQADRRYGVGFGSKKYWSDCRKECARILKPGGKAISFGWNSGGLGKKNGMQIERILLVAHGGGRNDTIVTVETKAVRVGSSNTSGEHQTKTKASQDV